MRTCGSQPRAAESGLVDDARWASFQSREKRFAGNLARIQIDIGEGAERCASPGRAMAAAAGVEIGAPRQRWIRARAACEPARHSERRNDVEVSGLSEAPGIRYSAAIARRAPPHPSSVSICGCSGPFVGSRAAPRPGEAGNHRPGDASAWRHPGRHHGSLHLRFQNLKYPESSVRSAKSSPDALPRPV